MARTKWADLKKKTFSPEEMAAIDADVAKMTREMSIAQIRKAIGMTQATIAQNLGVTQGEVSRLENRPDVYVSTLRRYIEAMSGSLELVAHFPGREDVRISLGELEQEPAEELAHA